MLNHRNGVLCLFPIGVHTGTSKSLNLYWLLDSDIGTNFKHCDPGSCGCTQHDMWILSQASFLRTAVHD